MMLEELEAKVFYHSPLIGESLPKIFLRDNRVEDLREGGNSSISDDFRVRKALSQFNHGRISPLFLVQDTQTFIERCLGSPGPSGSLLMDVMFRMLKADRCLVKRQMGRDNREPCGDICPQKHFGDGVECPD